MQMVQVGIGWEFPVKLICYSDGTVMLFPLKNFGLIVDQKQGGVTGYFDGNSFALQDTTGDMMDYKYHSPYKYKDMPLLKAWLVQQELVSPL